MRFLALALCAALTAQTPNPEKPFPIGSQQIRKTVFCRTQEQTDNMIGLMQKDWKSFDQTLRNYAQEEVCFVDYVRFQVAAQTRSFDFIGRNGEPLHGYVLKVNVVANCEFDERGMYCNGKDVFEEMYLFSNVPAVLTAPLPDVKPA